MGKEFKRKLSLLIAIALLTTSCPINVLAEDEVTGSECSSYELSETIDNTLPENLESINDETQTPTDIAKNLVADDEELMASDSDATYELATVSNADTTLKEEVSDTTPSDATYFDCTSGVIDGIKVRVTAEDGVFPAGAKLVVKKVSTTNEDAEDIEAAVDNAKLLEDDETKEEPESYTFDIKVVDKDGKELQPKNDAEVNVSFEKVDSRKELVEAKVYHLEKTDEKKLEELEKLVKEANETDDEDDFDYSKLDGEVIDNVSNGHKKVKDKTAEIIAKKETADNNETADELVIKETAFEAVELNTEIKDETNVVETTTEGFSYYVVEFYYGKYEYVLKGDSEIKLSAILKALVLDDEIDESKITKIEVSDNTLFVPYRKETEPGSNNYVWYVKALKAFDTEEKMTITADGIEYEIKVTDTQGNYDYEQPIQVTNLSELQDAIDAVFTDQAQYATIVLAEDIEPDQFLTYYTEGNISYDGITIGSDFGSELDPWAADINLTIDLGGNQIRPNVDYGDDPLFRAFTVYWGNITITNGTIAQGYTREGIDCKEPGYGGAILNMYANLTLTDLNIIDSKAVYGGSIANFATLRGPDECPTLSNVLIRNSTAEYGGAIANYGNLEIHGDQNYPIDECFATYGAAIANYGALKVGTNTDEGDDVFITGCNGSEGGGESNAIYNCYTEYDPPSELTTSLEIKSCTITAAGTPSIYNARVRKEGTDIDLAGKLLITAGNIDSIEDSAGASVYQKIILDPDRGDIGEYATVDGNSQAIVLWDTIIDEPIPTKDGYNFGGWYQDKDLTYPYDFSVAPSIVDEDPQVVYLIAKWNTTSEAEYEVTLDGNGATTAGTPSVTAKFNKAMPENITLPTRTNYSFDGYYDSKSWVNKYYNSDGSSAHVWDIPSNATLYAKWIGDEYKVTLNGNGATWAGTKSVTAEYGAAMPRIPILPSKNGYIFAGYYDDIAATSSDAKYYNADGTSAKNWDKTENTILTAKWVPRTYTVGLNARGGNGGDTSTIATYGQPMLAIATPSRVGYTFEGYYAGISATSSDAKYYNSDGTSAQNWNKTNNTTLYARWTKNPEYLTFTAEEAGSTICFTPKTGTVEISIDNGVNWNAYTSGSTITLTNVGDKVLFRGNSVTTDNSNKFVMTGKIAASGSVTSLTDGKGVDPEVSLSNSCYDHMFYMCSSLTEAPELPATTLSNNCYEYMFCACINMLATPELPAKTLADSCYAHMFHGCQSLTTVHALPIVTLADNSCNHMFFDCGSLKVNTSNGQKIFTCPDTTGLDNPVFNMFTSTNYIVKTPETGNIYYIGDITVVSDYLTFTAEEAGSTVCLMQNNGSAQYSTNNGIKWFNAMGATVTLTNVGDKVIYRGLGVTTSSWNHFAMTGKIAASGSVTSLTDGYGVDPDVDLSSSSYAYMFRSCTGLTTAPKLPAKTLSSSCYQYMFDSCTSLTIAPELPATTLASSCYKYMFDGCTGLTEAPALPAKTLAISCYEYMFNECSGITEAPELSVTTLANYCYRGMFSGCTSLNNVSELPASTLATQCYKNMFYGCTSLKVSAESGTKIFTYTDSVSSGAVTDMFTSTGGEFKGTPELTKTYYLMKYNVTLDGNGATTAGTTSVYALYGQPMPAIDIPSRVNYAFDGYYDSKDSTGVKYYNSDGTSAKNWDKKVATTLYAKWIRTAPEAIIVGTEKTGSIADMLNDAASGQTVKLLDSATNSDAIYTVKTGVTLDVAGYSLAAKKIILNGSLADTGDGEGLVALNDNKLVAHGNEYMPLYDTTKSNAGYNAYRLFKYEIKTSAADPYANNTTYFKMKFKIYFYESDGKTQSQKAYDLIANEDGDTKLRLSVGLVHINEIGVERSYIFNYSPESTKAYGKLKSEDISKEIVFYLSVLNYQLHAGSTLKVASQWNVDGGYTFTKATQKKTYYIGWDGKIYK